jgi:hypothetical protein
MNAQQQLLIASYWDNALLKEEQNELLDLLRTDPDVRAEFMNQMRLHRELEFVFSDTAEAESMALRRILLFLESSGANDQFVADIRKKYNAKPSARTAPARKSFAQQYVRESFKVNWGFRVAAALAASVLIIAGGYWLLNRNGLLNRPEYTSSISAMASVQSVEGMVTITRSGKTIYAVAGAQIQGQDTVVASSNGRAEIKYGTEETTIKLLSGATARFWLQDEAKRVRLDAGTLVCRIAKQAEGRAMHFVTPHAEAVVVGTQLKLAVSNDTTRLEVTEGKVELAMNEQGAVVVGAGEFAMAGKGLELKTQPIEPAADVQPHADQVKAQVQSASDYYRRWPNGIPADPNFFPIWVWNQDPSNAAAYKAAGINLYINPCSLSEKELAEVSAADMKLICQLGDTASRHLSDKTIVGWFNYNEPDRVRAAGDADGQYQNASEIIKIYNNILAKDRSRPVYLHLGEGVGRDDAPERGPRINHPEDYREYVKGADIADFRIFPVNSDDQKLRGKFWYIARGAENLRGCSDNSKPVWGWVECTKIFPDSPAKPTPAQVRTEVWMALIHGANGFGYMCHTRVPSFEPAGLLRDAVMLLAVSNINRQVASLAPVLNSPTIANGATVESGNAAVPVDIMVKKYGDATYIFAITMREGTTTATFTVPDGDSVEVLGESRVLGVSNGKFSDRFESYAVHIYKLSALSQARN